MFMTKHNSDMHSMVSYSMAWHGMAGYSMLSNAAGVPLDSDHIALSVMMAGDEATRGVKPWRLEKRRTSGSRATGRALTLKLEDAALQLI